MKKKSIILVVCFVLVLLAVLVSYLFLHQGSGYRQVFIKNYGLSVPAKWEITTEENKLLFTENGEQKGFFELLYEEYELSEIPGLYGYETVEPTVRESDQYAAKVFEISFESDGKNILQYVFDGLTAAPPYKMVLTLTDVSERVAVNMISKVVLPELSDYMPEKPMDLPEEELENMIYNIRNDKNEYVAHNVIKLEALIKKDAVLEVGKGMHILSFKEAEGERSLEHWYYLIFDGEKKYLYRYYKASDGRYIYDNDPQVIKEITKTFSEAEDYSRYLADGTIIFEGPYNHYSEKKNTLFAYKNTQMADKEKVEALIKEALPQGVKLEEVKVDAESNPGNLTVEYSLEDKEKYKKNGGLDEAAFYQNTLVLMSLIDDVDKVQINIKDEEGNYNKEYDRKEAEEQFENKNLSDFTADEEKFTEFTEEMPQITPPDGESGIKKEGTQVLKTKTVTLYPNSKIKHPSTGKVVEVEKYAKKYGVSQYLNKPITVTLNERVKKGKVSWYAAATCEGKPVGTYPLESKEEFDTLFGLMQ